LFRDLETKRSLLASSRVGIYLGGFPTFECHKRIYHVFDIDGEGKSPESAIARAQDLYAELQNWTLTGYTQWMLSGIGLRCVIPFLMLLELHGGFIRHLESLKDFGIDTGPYCGVDPPPIRLFGYLGHPKQRRINDKSLHRHSALIDTETLLSIQNESDYDHFTRRRPDPDQHVSWFREILPSAAYVVGDETAPPEIRAFLDHFAELEIQHEISAYIFDDFHFPATTGKRRLNLDLLLEYLRTRGIDASEQKDAFLMLSQCPECGRQNNAYLLPNGLCDVSVQLQSIPGKRWTPGLRVGWFRLCRLPGRTWREGDTRA
jgi:hypothetical protein